MENKLNEIYELWDELTENYPGYSYMFHNSTRYLNGEMKTEVNISIDKGDLEVYHCNTSNLNEVITGLTKILTEFRKPEIKPTEVEFQDLVSLADIVFEKFNLTEGTDFNYQLNTYKRNSGVMFSIVEDSMIIEQFGFPNYMECYDFINKELSDVLFDILGEENCTNSECKKEEYDKMQDLENSSKENDINYEMTLFVLRNTSPLQWRVQKLKESIIFKTQKYGVHLKISRKTESELYNIIKHINSNNCNCLFHRWLDLVEKMATKDYDIYLECSADNKYTIELVDLTEDNSAFRSGDLTGDEVDRMISSLEEHIKKNN